MEAWGKQSAAVAVSRHGVSATEAAKMTQELMPCRICGTAEKAFKCSRCKVAFYCGPEHQKLDWPVHKKACKAAPKGHPV